MLGPSVYLKQHAHPSVGSGPRTVLSCTVAVVPSSLSETTLSHLWVKVCWLAEQVWLRTAKASRPAFVWKSDAWVNKSSTWQISTFAFAALTNGRLYLISNSSKYSQNGLQELCAAWPKCGSLLHVQVQFAQDGSYFRIRGCVAQHEGAAVAWKRDS